MLHDIITQMVYFSHLWLKLLNFLFEMSWKYENETTFVRMRSSDHLGDAK